MVSTLIEKICREHIFATEPLQAARVCLVTTIVTNFNVSSVIHLNFYAGKNFRLIRNLFE